MSNWNRESAPQSVESAAEALLAVEPQEAENPAPQTLETASEQQERPQPEGGRTRDNNGRFVAREQAPPAQPETRTEPTPDTLRTPTEEIDYAAVARQQAEQLAELQRRVSSYDGNLRQKDAAIQAERERREAVEREAQATRENQLQQLRDDIAALPEETPEQLHYKARAERALLAREQAELRQQREAVEAEQRKRTEATTAMQRQAEDLGAKTQQWKLLTDYADQYGRQHGLEPTEINELVESLKTPELEDAFRNRPAEALTPVIMRRGSMLQAEIERRGQARFERNRQQAVQSGAHEREGRGQTNVSPPAWQNFTRDNVRRPGTDSMRDMALALLEE